MVERIYKLEALYLSGEERLVGSSLAIQEISYRLKAYRIAKISVKITIMYCSWVNLLDVHVISMVETINRYRILGGIPSGKLRRLKR
jgi:hypothetical protein